MTSNRAEQSQELVNLSEKRWVHIIAAKEYFTSYQFLGVIAHKVKSRLMSKINPIKCMWDFQ